MSIKSFTDLKAWQEAHKMVLMVYGIASHFPKNEEFALTSQIKRAASSVSSNISEGFGRSSVKDKEHYYVMASGSIYEVKNHLILARDLKYISEKNFKDVADQTNNAHRLLHGLLKTHRNS